MSSPDSYDDLELDPTVLHKLDLIEATLAASTSAPVDQSPSKLSHPDSDLPDADPILDAAEEKPPIPTPTPGLPSSKTPGCESPSFKTSSHTLIDCQAALCHDDIFPGSSLPEVPTPSGARQHSIDLEMDHTTSGKSKCKRRVGKRKARVLDEGGDEEHGVGTHQRPRLRKRGRRQSTHPQSRNRPPPNVLRHIDTAGMRDPGHEGSDSDDPIDFLHFGVV
jgi:hypothetical protein